MANATTYLPVSDALHPVVRIRIDVDRPSKMVRGPTIRLVDRDLLLVCVTDGHPGDVLLARELSLTLPDVIARIFGDSAQDSSPELEVSVLGEVESSSHRASDRNRILSWKIKLN